MKKKIEDNLNLGCGFWKRFAENKFLAFICTDNQGKITYINQAGERLYGYSSKELIGMNASILYRGIKLTPSMEKLLKQKSKSGEPWESELINVRKNGEKFPVWLGTHFLFDEHGKRTGSFSITRDITDDVKAREKAQLLASLTEHVDMALISTDEDGKITSINRAGERLFGYRENELLGRSNSFLYSQKNRPELLKDIKGKLEKHQGYTAELYRKKKDGSEFLTWLSSAPLRDNKGEFKGYLGISRDITNEKKNREKAVYMGKLIEASSMAIISTDVIGRIISVNTAAEKTYGYKAEEIIGENINMLYSERNPESKTTVLSRKSSMGKPWEAEVLRKNKRGEIFPVWLATSYIKDPNGKVETIIGISRDISEEKADREKINYLAELVDRASYCILSTENNIIKTINLAGERMYGYKSEELIGKNRDILYRGVKLSPEKLRELQSQMKKGEGWITELDNVKKNGEVFPVRVATAYLYDESGDKTGAVSITRDITQENKLKTELIKSANLASIGEVASGIAHEIKNPLSAIKNIVYLLSRNRILIEKSDTVQMIDDLKDEINRLDRMTMDFLDFARPRALRKELTDINQIIQDTLRLINQDKELTEGIQIKEALNKVPPVLVDANQIKQVILNITINALQAMKKKGTLSVVSSDRKEYVSFTINDTGCGISAESKQRIFEPFYSTKSKGSGLGMSIVKRIIDQHNGEIEIKSQLDQGTAITVSLPVNPAQ